MQQRDYWLKSSRVSGHRDRGAQMMELLKRDYAGASSDPDDQAHGLPASPCRESKARDCVESRLDQQHAA